MVDTTDFRKTARAAPARESMDRDLPLRTRMGLWMHLAMCRMCSGFARQMKFLRRAVRENAERLAVGEDEPEAKLSDQARERIKAALHDRP